MAIDKDVAVVVEDVGGIFRFIAIAVAALTAAGSILYAVGLAPLSNMQFETRLNEMSTRETSQIVDLEKRLDEKSEKRFLRLPQYEELLRGQRALDVRVTDLDNKMRMTFEQRLNELSGLIGRIDERSKNASDEIHDLHRYIFKENNLGKDNGRSKQ